MSKRLTEYVARLPADEAAALTLQEIALTALSYEVHQHESARMGEWAAVPQAIAAWLACPERIRPETEGMRMQWLLRDLVDLVSAQGAEALEWEEAAFLCKAFDLGLEATDSAVAARIQELLETVIPSLRDRMEFLTPNESLAALSARIRFLTADDISRSPARPIQNFAGINQPFTGPVVIYRGHVKVLDHVPENGAVVAEEGSCCVEGFLLGRVAAAIHIEVRENIGGLAVVREGDIRTRKIIDNAQVISKEGHIYCRQALSPRLVFAGGSIQVAQEAMLGTYIAPAISIQGAARGCVLHSCGPIEATTICPRAASDSRIVLRRRLSCLDYGERLSETGIRDMLAAAGLQRRLSVLRTIANLLRAESERHGENVLYYLACSASCHDALRELETTQLRYAVLARVLEGWSALAYWAEERLDAIARTGFAETERINRLAGGAFSAVRDELNRLMARTPDLEKTLQGAIETLVSVAGTITNVRADDRKIVQALLAVRREWGHCHPEVERLKGVIEKERAALVQAAGDAPLLRKAAKRPRALFVIQLFEALQDRSGEDGLTERIRSHFVLHAFDDMLALREQLRKHEATIRGANEEFQGAIKRIGPNNHLLLVLREGTEQQPACVSARFGSGVRVFSDSTLADASEAPSQSYVLPPECVEILRTYTRRPDGSIVAHG